MSGPTWRCVYCGHPLEEGEQCPMPKCVEERIASRRRMGLDPNYPKTYGVEEDKQ